MSRRLRKLDRRGGTGLPVGVAGARRAGAILATLATGDGGGRRPAMRARAVAPTVPADGLTELVRAEHRLAARLAAAREQAAALIAAARCRAASAGAGEPALAACLAAMREAAATSRERRLAEIRAAGHRKRQRWEGVSDARLADVANATVTELVAQLSRPAGGNRSAPARVARKGV